MALLTALSSDEASKLLGEYGLDLIELTPLQAGSVNSNFFLRARTERGEEREYFARVYEEQDQTGARFEVDLNSRLLAAGQPVARPLSTKAGELTLSFSGKPFAVYERLSGEVLCQARVTPHAARSVGAALAGVHRADLGGLSVPRGRFGFAGITERLDQVEASGRKDLIPALERARRLGEELQRKRRDDLPRGLTHGDLFRDNVLVAGQDVSGLLDFESACSGPFVYDLMVTILAWCYGARFDEDLVRAMVGGYLRHRSLSAEEFEAMVVEGSVACLRFVSTRLTDFSLRVPEGEAPGRNFQRFFDRLDALESGALDQALRGAV